MPHSLPSTTSALTQHVPTTIRFCGQQSSHVQRHGRYTPESYSHPAKMLPELCRQIIDRYTHPGETILDPFGGIGTTLVEGIHLGRHVILVEYEQKFVKMAQANAKFAVKQGATGTYKILCGDSRHLPDLLASSVDHIITSPPYGSIRLSSYAGMTERLKRLRAEGRITEKQYHHFVGRIAFEQEIRSSRYSGNPGNVGNRPYGIIDAVLTSPPYAKSPLRKESYLEAVFKVYQGCFALLKLGGFMIIVTRNFRCQNRLINLAGDTVRLMEHTGFIFYQHNIAILGAVKLDEEQYPYLLPRSSFWQTLLIRKAHQQHEPLNLIQHEDVLVFRKPVQPQKRHPTISS